MSGLPSPVISEHLLKKARALAPLRTAVVGADTHLVMESARLSSDEKFIEPVLVGRADYIARCADDIGWDISDYEVVDASTVGDAVSMSTHLASTGRVDALMKGHVHTDELIRSVLAPMMGLRTHRRLSHCFYMEMPGKQRSLCITDAVVNVLPSVREKIEIVKNAADLMHALGVEVPAIALLSGIESVTPRMPSSYEADEITRIAERGAIVEAEVFGPLSFDTAVSEQAAQIKGVTSKVAGNADVLVVPNLESGNFLFKVMVHFMGAVAAGVVLGAKVPVMITSRADPAQARLASAALALVYANHHSAS